MFTLDATRLFMLDMDGTFYLGNKLLPGAERFLDICRQKGIMFTFLTNNSSRGKADYIKKLDAMGVKIDNEQMFSSADATLMYMEENDFDRDILLIGTQSLEAQFKASGYNIDAQQPKAVILGFDTTITYEKLTKLCNAVRAGLPYIATHPDFNCPVEGGFIPDIGAVIAFVKASTGREPDAIIGKPNGYIAKAAAKRFGCKLSETCMVGDRLYTDIALGKCGCGAALVLCGETSLEEYNAQTEVNADIVCKDLYELGNLVNEAFK